MKKIMHVFAIVIIALQCSFAQEVFQPRTGDESLDQELSEINRTAKQNMERFKEDMKNNFGMGKERVEKILTTYKMEPADVVMASRIGKIVNKEPEVVCENFVKNKEKGWGVIAREMGIKPGSPEFHALKNAGKTQGNAKGKDQKGKGKSNGKGNGGAKEKGAPKEKSKLK